DDVVVPRTTLALARALGMDPVRDRSRFTTEIIRLFYSHIDRSAALEAARRDETPDAGAPVRVAVPLSIEAWNRLFKRPVPADQLVDRIVRDRDAALLCYALAALDEETLAYLGDHPATLERLYERDAAVFGAFGGSLKIHLNTVVPPGGDAAVPLWEAVVRQS